MLQHLCQLVLSCVALLALLSDVFLGACKTAPHRFCGEPKKQRSGLVLSHSFFDVADTGSHPHHFPSGIVVLLPSLSWLWNSHHICDPSIMNKALQLLVQKSLPLLIIRKPWGIFFLPSAGVRVISENKLERHQCRTDTMFWVFLRVGYLSCRSVTWTFPFQYSDLLQFCIWNGAHRTESSVWAHVGK